MQVSKVFIMCACACYLYVIMFVCLSVLCLHVCETICISVVIGQLQQKKYPTPWRPTPKSPTPALLPIGPTSRRDSLLCKLSTSRPRLSFSSCFSARSCCSSWTCREGVGGLSGPPGENTRQLGVHFLPPSTLPVSPGCGGNWPLPLAADRRSGDWA